MRRQHDSNRPDSAPGLTLTALVQLLARSAARDCLVTPSPLITPVDRSEGTELFTSPNDEG
jgi:hypothetical protein